MHEFSAPITPQQNEVVERKNRTLQEMVRTIMKAKDVPHKFWAKAMNTTYHIINRIYFRPYTQTTLYEILKRNQPNVKYFHIFGSTCFVLKHRDHLRKLDEKSEEAVFLGYSTNNRAYKVILKISQKFIESVNVKFDDYPSSITHNVDYTDCILHGEIIESTESINSAPNRQSMTEKNRPVKEIIGDLTTGVQTRK